MQPIASAVFAPFDEGGMTFISAAPLDNKEFQAFARAVKNASITAMIEPLADTRGELLQKLITLLEQDARHDPSAV